jgi:hypothetical protein
MMVRDQTHIIMFSMAYIDKYGIRRFPAGAIAPADWGEIAIRILPLAPSLQGDDWPWVAGSVEIRCRTDGHKGGEIGFGNPFGKWIIAYPNDHHRHRASAAAKFGFPMDMGSLRHRCDDLLHLTTTLFNEQQAPGTYGIRMECRTRAASVGRPMTWLEVARCSHHDLEWVSSLITMGVLKLKYVEIAQWRSTVQLGWQRCVELKAFGGMDNNQPEKNCRDEMWRRFAGKRDEFLWLAADLMIGSGRFARHVLRAMRFKFDAQPNELFSNWFDPTDHFHQSGGPGVAPFVAGSRAAQLYVGRRKKVDACIVPRGGGADGAAAPPSVDAAADDGAVGDDGGSGGARRAQPRAHGRAGTARQPMDRDGLGEEAQAVYDALPVKKLSGGKYAAYYLPAYNEERGLGRGKRPKTNGFVSHASLALHV